MPLSMVFMGTPAFAVPCLRQLLENGHRVLAVFSQPDKPKGRGYALQPPPVKELALEHGLRIFQPGTLRSGEAAALLKELAPDIAVVVAYGKILPKELLEIPRLGCVNVHASLLPHLRGAAPIQWSVANGDSRTGVTTMHMAEGMDTGDIILQRDTPIGKTETAGELSERLSAMGAALLLETLSLLEAGTAPRAPQDPALATYAPILTKEHAALHFTVEPAQLCNLVRGMHPAPCAWARLEGRLLKVHEAAVAEGYRGSPGEILGEKRLIVGCGSGAVELLRVQPEGKKVMDGAAFLCGRGCAKGQVFTPAANMP